MRALTLWQPWASLVAGGVKTIETRSWPAPSAAVGQRLAIHAAVRAPAIRTKVGAWTVFRAHGVGPLTLGRSGNVTPEGQPSALELPVGAVIATARLAACVPMVEFGADGSEGYDGGPACWEQDGAWWLDPDPLEAGATRLTEISEQVPYGDFAPGRWAWLLEDVVSLPSPIPARGAQRIWHWTSAA